MTQYLNRKTKAALSSVRISEYPLPYDPDTIVRVKSQSVSFINSYGEAVEAGGERAKEKTYSLLALSIVDENDEPVWTADEIGEMKKADGQLILTLIAIVGKHNAVDDQGIEAIAKNFVTTE